MADCLASTWEDSVCKHRDYINVAATAKFYIDDTDPEDIKAELRASSDSDLGEDLVYEWVEDCKNDYMDILVDGDA